MMKAVRFVLILAVVLSTALAVNAQKKGDKTVVFNANLHCGSCKAKVEKNLPYEKGVKDLKVDMDAQTITVTFREDKNTTENLQKAIEKLSVQVKGIAGADTKVAGSEVAKDGQCCGTKDCKCSGSKENKKETDKK